MIWLMVKRNLKIYFRDKIAVFFSLLGVIIIIGLYVLFLGNMLTRQTSNDIPIDTGFIISAWVMAGVVTIATITTSMGAFGAMVQDKSKKIIYDFEVSPMKRTTLVLSYVLSALIVSLIMSFLTLLFSEIYFLINVGQLLGFVTILKCLGLLIFAVISSSTFVFMLVSFFNNNTAFTTASSIIGSLIGFLAGVYIPIGTMPTSVQRLIQIFPLSHAAVLMRQAMMSGIVDLNQVPTDFKESMGVNFYINNTMITNLQSILYILVTSILFLGVAVIVVSRKNKKI